VTETARLRALVFERTGMAIDEKDPIMAVLIACADQTEQISTRILRRSRPQRLIVTTAIVVVISSLATAAATWQVAQREARALRAEWVQQQRDPRVAALLASEQGRAGLRLSELGVARLLANCSGRSSWRVQKGYCIPMTAAGQPDGFKVGPARAGRGD